MTKEVILKFLKILLRAFLIACALVFLASYIIFSPPVLTSTCGDLILFPMPPGEEYSCQSVNFIKRREIWFKNKNGDELEGWLFKLPDENAPLVLFAHGNAGNMGHRLMLAKYLMDAGASVFLFDYRSYGLSKGKKSLPGVIEDTQAAFDCLTKELKFPPSKIILYGESIGGGPTCVLAAREKVKGVILDSTFTSALQLAKKRVPIMNIYPDFLQPVPPFDNQSYLRGAHVPVLIIHGQKDELVPFSEAQENFAAASAPKELLCLPQSTHNWKDADFDIYREGVRKFLKTIFSAETQANP